MHGSTNPINLVKATIDGLLQLRTREEVARLRGVTTLMDLTNCPHGVQKRKLKKRVGRGIGSGHGKTASRGHKGQYASAGAGLPSGLFEGGQMPLFPPHAQARLHATPPAQKDFAVVNVGDLDASSTPAATVDMAALKATRLVVGTFDGVRILGDGELTKKLTVKADHFSKSAQGEDRSQGRHRAT